MDLPRLTPCLLFRRTLRNIGRWHDRSDQERGLSAFGRVDNRRPGGDGLVAAEPLSRRGRSIPEGAEACPTTQSFFAGKMRIWNGGSGNS